MVESSIGVLYVERMDSVMENVLQYTIATTYYKKAMLKLQQMLQTLHHLSGQSVGVAGDRSRLNGRGMLQSWENVTNI